MATRGIVAGGEHRLAGLDVRTSAADVLTRVDRAEHPHRSVRILLGLFHHHHGVGPVGHRRPRGDLGAAAAGHGPRRHLARVDLLDEVEQPRVELARAERVFGGDGVAIHRRTGERRHVLLGDDGHGEHAPDGRLERHGLDARHRARRVAHERPRLFERNRLTNRPH
jgi:hypothetical protein